jgi:hypothetical protein
MTKMYQITFTEKEVEVLMLMCACSIGIITSLPGVSSAAAMGITNISNAAERADLADKFIKALDSAKGVPC